MLLTEKASKALCDKILGYTRADDAEVAVSSDDFSHLRFAANGFTTSGRVEDTTASITVWIDKKRGSASSNDLEEPSLRMAVQQAEQLARLSPVDKEYLPTLGPQTYKPTGGFSEATVNLSLSARAKAINEIIRACEKAGVIGAGFHHASGAASAFASKNGNFQYRRSSLVSLSVTARATDGSSSGYFLRNQF